MEDSAEGGGGGGGRYFQVSPFLIYVTGRDNCFSIAEL